MPRPNLRSGPVMLGEEQPVKTNAATPAIAKKNTDLRIGFRLRRKLIEKTGLGKRRFQDGENFIFERGIRRPVAGNFPFAALFPP